MPRDIMSLDIKSSAFLRVEHPVARKFDMSSTSGYMDAKSFQEFGPRFFDMSSASGYIGANYLQECGPRFVACHVPNAACHGMPISIVSISSVSCRVRILHGSVSMPCHGHPD